MQDREVFVLSPAFDQWPTAALANLYRVYKAVVIPQNFLTLKNIQYAKKTPSK